MAALSLRQAAGEFEIQMLNVVRGAPDQANCLSALVLRIREGYFEDVVEDMEATDEDVGVFNDMQHMIGTFACTLPAGSPHSEVRC